MLEAYGDIWDNIKDYDAVVITTNGFVKRNGALVMGRGIAKEARDRYFDLDQRIGQAVKKDGNHVYGFHMGPLEPIIITFPVKPEFGLRFKPGWMAKADPELIKRSAEELVQFTNGFKYNEIVSKVYRFDKVLMPRPGCGNGGLKWEDVKPIIEPILDDRFIVMHNG